MADSKKTGQVIDTQTDINWSISPSLLSLSLPFPSFSIIPLFLYNFFAFLWLLPTFYLGCIPHHSPFAFASAWMIGRSPLSIYDDYYVTLNLYTLIMISLLPPSLYICVHLSACLSVCNQMGSPMPGSVEKLLVTEGQLVAAGETLCTISAMKMEVKVTSPFAGKVASLSVAAGTRVVEGALLLTLAVL